MPFTKIRGATKNFGKPADWNEDRDGKCGDLWVRVDRYGSYPQHNFAWKPDAHELAALNAGAEIEVHLVGLQFMPPVGMSVVIHEEPPAEKPTVTINEHGHGFDEHGPATP